MAPLDPHAAVLAAAGRCFMVAPDPFPARAAVLAQVLAAYRTRIGVPAQAALAARLGLHLSEVSTWLLRLLDRAEDAIDETGLLADTRTLVAVWDHNRR